MWKNYLKIAYRNALRQKGYTIINIAGLTLGLACCLVIFQYVAFEYSFDDFNENAPNLYRVNLITVRSGSEPSTGSTVGWAMGPALAQEVPEVARFARLHPENAIVSNPAAPDIVFEEERVYYADPAFFQMFSYPLVKGDPGQALSEPGTVVLSEWAARKYFGTEDPIGQILDVTGRVNDTFRVVGIFEDVPANSHLQFDLLLPMQDVLQTEQYREDDGWGWWNFITYVQLRADADPAAVGRKFTDVLMSHLEEDFRQRGTTARVDVQPLQDVHLNDDISAPKAIMGSYRAVYFFTLIGLVTLLIALVNYVNLATARAMGRAREVGVRKAAGAQREQLVTQFLFESALTNVVAVVLAVALAATLRPVVNNLAGTNLTNAIWTSPGFWAVFVVTFCATTLLAGLYPAFVLSSFKPASVLKGKASRSATGSWLRRGLVVLQFAASITLLVGTAVVHEQLDFMRNMDLGLNLEQILAVHGPRVLPEGTNRAVAIETFTQELRQLPAIRQTATSNKLPGEGFNFYASNIRRAGADPAASVVGGATRIDTSFASLYGLKLVAGEGFKNITNPTPEGGPRPVIATETAVQALGFDTPADALNQVIYFAGIEGRLVGVFEDFHWSSAHEARENAFFFLSRGERQVSLKVSTEDLPRTLAAVERIYERLFPGNPFSYAFVDEQFDQQYKNDQRFARLFSIFAGLAIAIACLGLFGLAAYAAERRTKEIGVRKVLGASVPSIVALLSKDFLKLVLVAFVIAAPVAYFAMSRWLEGFAYLIDLGAGVFLVAGVLALVIALATVSYQAIRAALANPVEALRDE